MITVYIRKIEKINKETEQQLISSLSDSARAHFDKKKNEALRAASLCALSLIPQEMIFDIHYTRSGRPYFNTLDADVSISHSSSYSAVAISSSRELTIGIDIEDKDGKINAQKCSRFFSENEIAEMKNGISPIEIWTKKEALFKHLKNDSLVFFTLDTTVSNCHFNTKFLDGAIITLCTEKDENIDIIDKTKS